MKKRRLESKYISFYEKARLRVLVTEDDILLMEEDSKEMMLMLSGLGVDAYKLLYGLF